MSETGKFVGEDRTGVCWWCGDPADSLEHRFKRSDLVRLQGPSREAIVWGSPEGVVPIQGPGSRKLRFGKVLCSHCNNARSQAFDRAYAQLTDFWVQGAETLAESPSLDLLSIFGEDWRILAADAARYYVKYMGCLMADRGMRPPEVMRRFLDGDDHVEELGLHLVLSESHFVGYMVMRDASALWNPGATVWLRRGDLRPTAFKGEALVGFAGVRLVWEEASGHHDSFFHHRRPGWNLLPAVWEEPEEAALLRPQVLPGWWLALWAQEGTDDPWGATFVR